MKRSTVAPAPCAGPIFVEVCFPPMRALAGRCVGGRITEVFINICSLAVGLQEKNASCGLMETLRVALTWLHAPAAAVYRLRGGWTMCGPTAVWMEAALLVRAHALR